MSVASAERLIASFEELDPTARLKRKTTPATEPGASRLPGFAAPN
jgi:hypothetical protein